MSILLADRILGGCPLLELAVPFVRFDQADLFKDLISRAEIIDYSNVTKYQWENHLVDQWGLKELFNVMPPFDLMWMDTANEGVGAPPGLQTPLRSGILFHTTRNIPIPNVQKIFGNLRVPFQPLCDFSEWETCAFVQASVFQFYKLKKPFHIKGASVYEDYALFCGASMFAVLPNGKPLTAGVMSGMNVDYNVVPKEHHQRIRDESRDRKPLVNEVLTALFAIQFAHCKNVRLKTTAPDEKLSQVWNRKKKKLLLTYKTIEIEPMKRVLETEGGLGKNGIQKALHLCRGHFATYTPEKGMMGRKLEEPVTVWKPAHVRGSKEFGEVKKDYRIKV